MAAELTNQNDHESSTKDRDPLLPVSETLPSTSVETPTKTQAIQLIFGAGGIYASFLYYGSLQEDVFRYTADDGTKFNHVWFLQFLESLANVLFGTMALIIIGVSQNKGWWGGTPNLPKKPFLSTGLTQVCSKGFTSLALANGLSFPVATLVSYHCKQLQISFMALI
eukprot:scaffold18229_cov73-Cyclotella_meneghiniana.AAC.3